MTYWCCRALLRVRRGPIVISQDLFYPVVVGVSRYAAGVTGAGDGLALLRMCEVVLNPLGEFLGGAEAGHLFSLVKKLPQFRGALVKHEASTGGDLKGSGGSFVSLGDAVHFTRHDAQADTRRAHCLRIRRSA